ncbi:unnamed protein product [Peniophora sp. CBMAI 1063]|nr:unnamed protein product [Peniophora sp. CBMAI 1063]
MAAVDPTYPLYPIACSLASMMLLLVLLTSFVRRSWNLGVAFLCFWLFFENLINGIGTIIWFDNADIKLYVYCDIVSHVQVITSVVKPVATLIITRRLCLIVNLRSIEPLTKAVRRRNLAIEWTLGMGIPILVAGPLYYVVQVARFKIVEGFGCSNEVEDSILSILFIQSWNVLLPLVSVTVYYPRVAQMFYRHHREINHFLQSNDSVTRPNYLRILALASIDILLMLPVGIANIVLFVKDEVFFGSLPFYYGWTFDHTRWQPQSITYTEIVSNGPFSVATFYFFNWISPFLAFVIFGLFGATQEARVSYWRIICTVGGWFGWKPTPRTRRSRSSVGDIVFGERPAQNSMSLDLESNPSYIDGDACAQGQIVESGGARISVVNNASEKAGKEEAHLAQETNLSDRNSDAERPAQPPGGSHEASLGDAAAVV